MPLLKKNFFTVMSNTFGIVTLNLAEICARETPLMRYGFIIDKKIKEVSRSL